MQTLRKVILLLMIIALSGPWAIERLSIPEPNNCIGGFRVDENFCGYPISGLQIFIMVFVNIFGAAFRLVAGNGNLNEFVISLLVVFFIVLPIISTLLFIASKDKPLSERNSVQIGVLGLAIMLGLWGIVSDMIQPMWELWGIWLYMLLLVSEMAVEILKQVSRARQKQVILTE